MITKAEMEYLLKVPNELHKINQNLEKLIELLKSKENGTNT